MHYLAHFSRRQLRDPLDWTACQGLADHFGLVQAASEAADGFISREDSLDVEDYTLSSLELWGSAEELQTFEAGPVCRPFLLRGAEWFECSRAPQAVVWWASMKQPPTVHEGLDRLAHLQHWGPGPDAFTLSRQFPTAKFGERSLVNA